jgi:hypothetical protein
MSSVAIKSTKNLNNNKLTPPASSQYAWNILPAMRLFKEISLTIFEANDEMQVRKCVDDIENNSDLGSTPYKELWDKCAQINIEFFQKQQMDQQKNGLGGPANTLGLNSLQNYDQILINEYKTLFESSRSAFMKTDCLPLFSKVRGNVYDLLDILKKPEYMGFKFTGTNNQQFISSQFSVYRQKLPANAFKKLNEASNNLMSNYKIGLDAINTQRRGIPKAPKLYDNNDTTIPNALVVSFFSLFYLNFFLS